MKDIEITIDVITNDELLNSQLSKRDLTEEDILTELRTVTIPLGKNKIIYVPYLKSELLHP